MEELLFEIRNKKAIFTLNRPDSFNALTDTIIEKFMDSFSFIKNNLDIRIVILKANGKAFCAGVDVKGKEYNPINARAFLIKLNKMFDELESLPQPSIALINGPCVAGGLELALSCTFRFGINQAKFGLPEVTLGLVPAGGASFRLPRLIGFGKALEIALTGKLIKGNEAEKIGLLNKSFETIKEMEDYTEKFSQKIIDNAPYAITFTKDCFYRAFHSSSEISSLIEILSASVNHYTEDKKEGIKAFFEKRKPNFRGK